MLLSNHWKGRKGKNIVRIKIILGNNSKIVDLKANKNNNTIIQSINPLIF